MIKGKFLQSMWNEITQCKKCRYGQKGVILDKDNPKYYRIISNKINPKLFLYIFNLQESNDNGTELELEILEYNRRIEYKYNIINCSINNKH